jgi:hypothetical protein
MSKEERNALIKELDKNSLSHKYSAVAATQEPTTATNREDILLSLIITVQEVRDAACAQTIQSHGIDTVTR